MDLTIKSFIDRLDALNFSGMYGGDFLLTWEKGYDELQAARLQTP